jgi:glycosyltransferase involved in cell wall biosynthesis
MAQYCTRAIEGSCSLKLTAIIPFHRSGAFLYSLKLYSRLPSRVVSTRRSLIDAISNPSQRDTQLYHIQYEYRAFGGFFGSLVLLLVLAITLGLKSRVVVTLHGLIVYQSVANRRFGWLLAFAFFGFIRLTALFASSFIVHSELMKRVLNAKFGINKVVVIPHGTDSKEPYQRFAGKDDRILFFGFIRPSKGIENVIDALEIIRRTRPDVVMTIAGSIARSNEKSYLQSLQARVREKDLVNYVDFQTEFIDVERRSQLLRSSTVVVLPYTDLFVEVSGVVHDIAEYGVPIICSPIPRFSELVDGFDCLKVSPTSDELANAILRILTDCQLRSRLGTNLRLKAEQQSWDVVARRHVSLYRTLLTGAGRATHH